MELNQLSCFIKHVHSIIIEAQELIHVRRRSPVGDRI